MISDKQLLFEEIKKKQVNDSDYSNDDFNQIKLQLKKRNISHNNSRDHIKILNSNYRDPKICSNLINSLKSVESDSTSLKERHKNDYNDYNTLNVEKNNPNTFNPSETNSSGSRSKVKEFLSEVKEMLDTKRFKVFIKNVKSLTDKTQNVNRKQVFEHVKEIFGDDHYDLYNKFEKILSPSSNIKFA